MNQHYYNYNKDTLIVNQTPLSANCYSAIPEFPKNALLTAPLPPKEGFAVRVCEFKDGRPTSTEYVIDNRGKNIFHTEFPSLSKRMEELGDLEDGWTLLAPSTPYDEWNKLKGWVTNRQNKYESDLEKVREIRELLYTQIVDRLNNEAKMIRRVEGNEAKAAEYEAQADAAYLKIRADNPWPVAPITE